jgi:hypothetical protein
MRNQPDRGLQFEPREFCAEIGENRHTRRIRDRKFNRGRSSLRRTYGPIADDARAGGRNAARAAVAARVWQGAWSWSITNACVMQATRRITP